MSNSRNNPAVLVDSKTLVRPLPRSIKHLLAGLSGAVVFACLTALGAEIRIPIQPVPVTLQTLFVLLAGAIIGARYGSLSQSIYILMGMLGVPFLAGAAGGLSVLVGPTGGYLAGFVVAAFVVGRLISVRSGFAWHLSVFSIGTAVVLTIGVLHLSLFYTHDLGSAIKLGLIPFLIGDTLKVFAAASIYRSFAALNARRRG